MGKDNDIEALEYAKKLSAQLHVGIHLVTLDKSEFMEIYKKEPYLLQR